MGQPSGQHSGRSFNKVPQTEGVPSDGRLGGDQRSVNQAEGWPSGHGGSPDRGPSDDHISEFDMPLRGQRHARSNSPGKTLVVLLRRQYSVGFIQLANLRRTHRRLQEWTMEELVACAHHSFYRGARRFQCDVDTEGELHICLSDHLRRNRRGE